MADPRSKLRLLVPGDIIRGHDSGGAILICLVEAVGPDRVETRRLTTQDRVTFAIETGEEVDNPDSRLDSIEPLPLDVYKALLGLDRRMRLGKMPLSEAEKDALQFVADFYSVHPVEAFLITEAGARDRLSRHDDDDET